MMVEDRSENAFDTIRIRGKWWIPDGTAEPKKVPGELTFEVGSGGVLDLDDALSDDIQKIPVIHGQGRQGESITIFNGSPVLLPLKLGFVVFSKREVVEFFDMWVGNYWFDDRQAVRFKEYSFGIHDIENWADRNCFSVPHSADLKCSTLFYESPEPILLFEDESLRIVLDSFKTGPTLALGQLESSIRHYPRIVIRSKQGLLSYYEKEGSISDREWMIFVLIALLMGAVTWKFGFEGVVEPIHETEDGYDPEVSVRHYFQHDWGEVDPLKRPVHSQLLFPYETIGEEFPKLASRFSEVFHANENPVAIVYRLQCRKGTLRPSTLPELLFAFEELEKNLLRELNEPIENDEKTFADELRKKLKPHCTKDEWNWASQKLMSQGLSFQKRCLLAFKEMASVFPELDAPLSESLARHLKNSRNDYAHAVKSTSDNHVLYVYTSHWMAEFMTLMVLRACGLSDDKIKDVFFRDPGPDHGKTKRFFDYLRSEIAAGRLK